jgi:hypothetical protein
MALVKQFQKVPGSVRLHPTEVDAEVKIGDLTGSELIVQIDTRGSDQREIEGKLSQTLQLTRGSGSAHQLYGILKETFGFES